MNENFDKPKKFNKNSIPNFKCTTKSRKKNFKEVWTLAYSLAAKFVITTLDQFISMKKIYLSLKNRKILNFDKEGEKIESKQKIILDDIYVSGLKLYRYVKKLKNKMCIFFPVLRASSSKERQVILSK